MKNKFVAYVMEYERIHLSALRTENKVPLVHLATGQQVRGIRIHSLS
jgi:hypothetical protein